MVKITNYVNTFEVTQGAYDDIFKKQGFDLVEEDKEETIKEEATGKDYISEEEAYIDELMEKPISQWNKEEVKHFAAIKKIDISGTKNANEAKEIIKSFIDGE